MTKQFETTFIIDSYLSDQEIESSITKYTKFIEKNGGAVKNVDRWGKRRLAYEIKKKQYGYYVYVRFEMDGSIIKELEREYKLDDAIIRYLTVLVPKVVVSQENFEKMRPAREEEKSDTGKAAKSSEKEASGSKPEKKEEADSSEPEEKEEADSSEPEKKEEADSSEPEKKEEAGSSEPEKKEEVKTEDKEAADPDQTEGDKTEKADEKTDA